MDSALDIGGPSEPSPTLPPLRAWRVVSDNHKVVTARAHNLSLVDGALQFVTYILMGGEPIGQISQLVAPGHWLAVEAVTIQPEGASVQ